MHTRLVPAVVAGLLICASLWPIQVFGEAQPSPAPGGSGAAAPNSSGQNEPDSDGPVCSVAPRGFARCHARVRTDLKAQGRVPARSLAIVSQSFPDGSQRPADRLPQPGPGTVGNGGAYDPAYLQSAYNVTGAASTAGQGQTVAIVDAYDAPNAEADLNVYRSNFGLAACTTANGCFRKVNQTGATAPLPAVDASWAQEVSLDLDMVSAICPRCKIQLVEANSSSFADLGIAVNSAAALKATVISNSYGAGEWNGEAGYWESFYNHPGIPVTASTGDAGYGVEFPAASTYTIAVGGTTLNQTTNNGTRTATETVWSGAGSGCSAYIPKPSWQHDVGCSRRTVADIAAVADPSTGVWVYDSTPSGGRSGWLILGGTSVSAPIVGSVYALAANGPIQYAAGLYSPGAPLFDITSGSNGSCGVLYLCTGVAGYDGPTGNGSPNSTTAFSSTLAPTATSTPVASASATPTPTNTAPTSTSTPTPSPTSTLTPTASATATHTPTHTATATATTPPAGNGVNAYATIQAESFTSKATGPQTEPTTDIGGGLDIGYIRSTDWLGYDSVHFGSTAATQFIARVASNAAGGATGVVEVHLDSVSAPTAGSFVIANTGGYQSWVTVATSISPTTSTHAVFLRFTSTSTGQFVNLNWFSFAH